MARFELDDGTLQKFWEIELDGEVLRFRYGEIGTLGRTRSKRHGSEQQARHAHEMAVRTMAAQGYLRRIETPRPNRDTGPVWGALEQDPTNLPALAVHADWLQGLSEPRGDLLATQLAALSATEGRRAELDGAVADLLAHHSVALCGPPFPGEHTFRWGLGYLESASFGVGGARGNDPAEAAADLLSRPGFRLLRSLSLHVPCATRIALAGSFPSLERLSLNTFEGQRDAVLDLDALHVVAPRLSSLQVRGQGAVRGSAALDRLEELDIRWTRSWKKPLAGRRLPARVGLHGVNTRVLGSLDLRDVEVLSLAPSWGADVHTMLRALQPVGLRHLRLESVEVDLGLAEQLIALGTETIEVGAAVTQEALARLTASGRVPTGQFVVARDSSSDGDDEPERPNDLEITRWEVVSKRGRWFWEIGVDGPVHHVRYGVVGQLGRWVWRRFPSEDVAEEMAQRRIDEKLREGYRAVASAPSAVTA